MDSDSKTVALPQCLSSRKNNNGTDKLCEDFRDKLSLKEDGQGDLANSVAKQENYAVNYDEVHSDTNSVNQGGKVKKLVERFSLANSEMESSSTNTPMRDEIKNTALNSFTSPKTVSTTATFLVTEITETKVHRRSSSSSRHLTSSDETLPSQITGERQRARRKSDSYHGDFPREIKQSDADESVVTDKLKAYSRHYATFNKQFDVATGKKRSQSPDKQSVHTNCISKFEKEEKNTKNWKAEALNENKGGKTVSKPSTTVENKLATSMKVDSLYGINVSDSKADYNHKGQAGRDTTVEQRQLNDEVAESMKNHESCKETQPKEDLSDALAENINLSVLDGEMNLESINNELRKLLDHVENIQKSSIDNLQNRNVLMTLQALLKFKDIASSGLLCKGMPNYGLVNDNILGMIGVLLKSLNLFLSDFKEKLDKCENIQLDGMHQDPSGKAIGNQNQGQVKKNFKVPVDNLSDTHRAANIIVMKEIFTDTSNELISSTKISGSQTDAIHETTDTLSQTDASCETKDTLSQTEASCDTKDSCPQTDAKCEISSLCGKDLVTVEKENMKANTISVTTDTHRNGSEKDNQRSGTKAKIETMQIPRVVVSHNKSVCQNEKVLLLLGASGCGKTTLVKLIACFYAGIKSPDEYLVDDTRYRIENLVQHSTVTAFTAYPENPVDPAITIIDTPGLNDSSGDLIQSRIDDLQRFLTDAVALGLEINAIGYVIQAHVSRLTPSERLVMDYVKRHFKECSAHIIPMITFADSQRDPPVLKAMKEFDVSSYFLFNNSVLTFDDNEEISDMERVFWRRGFKCWRNICKLLQSLSAVKIFEIRNKKASVLESGKSETKDVGPLSEKTKAVSVQTYMNYWPLNEKERQDKSRSTEMDACEMKVYDKQIETVDAQMKAIHNLKEALFRFVTSADNCYGFWSVEWKREREEVWKKANIAYQFVVIDIPCDVWVYSFATEILREGLLAGTPQRYLCVLALSESKSLVNIARAVIRNAKAEFYQIHRYVKSNLCIKWWVASLQAIVIDNAKRTLQKALVANKVHEIMDTPSFLRHLRFEVDESLSKFIHDVMLKN